MMSDRQFPFSFHRRHDTAATPRPHAVVRRLLTSPVTRMHRGAVAGGVSALALGLLASAVPAAQASQGSPRAGLHAHVAQSGYEAAFQANTGKLWVVHNGVGRNLGLAMKAGTRPPSPACRSGAITHDHDRVGRSRPGPPHAACIRNDRR
jgi:hypothetical protein